MAAERIDIGQEARLGLWIDLTSAGVEAVRAARARSERWKQTAGTLERPALKEELDARWAREVAQPRRLLEPEWWDDAKLDSDEARTEIVRAWRFAWEWSDARNAVGVASRLTRFIDRQLRDRCNVRLEDPRYIERADPSRLQSTLLSAEVTRDRARLARLGREAAAARAAGQERAALDLEAGAEALERDIETNSEVVGVLDAGAEEERIERRGGMVVRQSRAAPAARQSEASPPEEPPPPAAVVEDALRDDALHDGAHRTLTAAGILGTHVAHARDMALHDAARLGPAVAKALLRRLRGELDRASGSRPAVGDAADWEEDVELPIRARALMTACSWHALDGDMNALVGQIGAGAGDRYGFTFESPPQTVERLSRQATRALDGLDAARGVAAGAGSASDSPRLVPELVAAKVLAVRVGAARGHALRDAGMLGEPVREEMTNLIDARDAQALAELESTAGRQEWWDAATPVQVGRAAGLARSGRGEAGRMGELWSLVTTQIARRYGVNVETPRASARPAARPRATRAGDARPPRRPLAPAQSQGRG